VKKIIYQIYADVVQTCIHKEKSVEDSKKTSHCSKNRALLPAVYKHPCKLIWRPA